MTNRFQRVIIYSRLYNVEVNTYDDDDHAKRIRFYSSMIDSSSLNAGKPYRDLTDLYMIYISTKDPFADENDKERKLKNHYEIKQYVDGLNIPYDNGLHIHYFNTEVKDDDNSG